MEKRIRERLALIDAYKEQIRHKRLLRQKEKEEEEVFRKKVTAQDSLPFIVSLDVRNDVVSF